MKHWQFSKPDKETAHRWAEEYGISPFLAILLRSRGFESAEAVERYCAHNDWCNPMDLPDMPQAVRRIRQAIDAFEPILVYGDYDADGVTSTAMLVSYLDASGGNVRFALPNRETGYGLTKAAVDRAAEQKIRLIITVDNGVSAAEEVAYAASLGIDTVVTDHHKVPETLPAAVAVIDPHRTDVDLPFRDWCGAGVVFKLIAALEDVGDELPEELLSNFADLAAIGTVADIVPLLGENRMLATAGLQQLRDTSRIGLHSLMQSASLLDREKLTAGAVSFSLAPRINAMGRMATSEHVVQLFLTDYEEEARSIAAELEEANAERQKEENAVQDAAMAYFRTHPRVLLDRVLVVPGSGWHPGVLGIVASRITEKFGKPSIVVAVQDDGAVGSCRSLGDFSIVDALTACAPMLRRFGGHTLAAGFSMDAARLDEFTAAVNAYAASQPQMPIPALRIDCKLNPAGLSPSLVTDMQPMEPFGAGNPTPVFAILGVRLMGVQPMGGSKHLRLTVERDGSTAQALLFRTTPEQFPYRVGDTLDLAVTLELSAYRGAPELSVIVRDYRPADFDAEPLIRQKQTYEALARGELTGAAAAALRPDRAQIAAVYRLLKAEGEAPRSMEYLCYRLRDAQIGYDRLSIALVALRQLGLIALAREADVVRVRIHPAAQKVQLDSAPILQKIQEAVGV